MRSRAVNYPTDERRRRDDLAFLGRIKTASAAELRQMRLDHWYAKPWKREAIERALARLGAGRIDINVVQRGFDDDFG